MAQGDVNQTPDREAKRAARAAAQEAAREAKRDVRDAARDAKDAVRDAVRSAASEVRQAARDAAAEAREAAREGAAEARRSADEAIREAKKEAKAAVLSAQRSTREAVEDLGVSATLEAAWGRSAGPRRGPRPALTVAQIIEAAVALADREGLAAVSMSSLAADLGTKPMSLYRYVESKEQLLALMVDAAAGKPGPRVPGEAWRAGVERWAWALLAANEAHPWVVEIPIGGPPDTPNQVAWMEDMLSSLQATNLTPGERMSTLLIVSGYVRNSASVSTQVFAATREVGGDLDREMAGYTARLRHLADPAAFPRLHEVLNAGVFDRFDHPHEEFAFGLERVLDGIAALVDAAQGRPDESAPTA